MVVRTMNGMFIKKMLKKNKLIFVPTKLGLDEIEISTPKPSKYYIPPQFKNMPAQIPSKITKHLPIDKTAKMCPSFTEIFNEGFVLPAHTDMHFYIDKENKENIWTTSNRDFEISGHPDYQYLDYLDNNVIKAVYKIPYPYLAIIPKGYSIRQVPMLYHHNQDWHVAYGTYRGDQIADIQLQVFITSNSKEVLIKQGEPLCYFIPYKRESWDMEIHQMNDKYKKIQAASELRQRSSFKSSYLKNTSE